VDYWGNDIADQIVNNENECFSWCESDNDCKVWTYRMSDKHCWLKSSDAGREPGNGLVSGTKSCTAQQEQEQDEASTVAPSGYTYIGCFVDDEARDLEYRIGRLQAYNQESCHNACAQRYFALQWHGSCWCGDAYGTEVQYEQVEDEQCGSDRLGRGWRNAIYSHPAQQEQEEEEEEEEEVSTVAPSTGYTYIGCYVDDAARDLKTRIGRRQAYNQESCHDACDQRYFALQWHGSCWCGDAYGTEVQYKKVADEECGFDRLGRGWRNAIYSHKDTPSLSDTASKIKDTISNIPGTIPDTISNNTPDIW